MFIHTDWEKVKQFPIDHNGVSTIDESMSQMYDTWCHKMRLKKHGIAFSALLALLPVFLSVKDSSGVYTCVLGMT